MSSPEDLGGGDLPESCSNYSMLSVEEEVESSQPSQLTGTKSKSNGNIFFDESTRASSNELGISPSPNKSYYKLVNILLHLVFCISINIFTLLQYTKQSSEVPSLLASVSEVSKVIVKASLSLAFFEGGHCAC